MSALPGADKTLVRKRRWQKSPVTGESAKETVKTIACGNAGRFRCTRCYSCAFYHYQVHARLRVQRAPGIPHALEGAEDFMHDSGASRREVAKLRLEFSAGMRMRAPDAAQRHKRVHARLRRAMSCVVVRC